MRVLISMLLLLFAAHAYFSTFVDAAARVKDSQSIIDSLVEGSRRVKRQGNK